MKINFVELNKTAQNNAVLVLAVGKDKKLSAAGKDLDKQSGGVISKAIASGKFAGKPGQYLSVALPSKMKADRVVLAGYGEAKNLTHTCFEKMGGGAIPHINAANAKSAAFLLDGIKCKVPSSEAAARIGHGAYLRSYFFDKYFTKRPDIEKSALKTFSVAVSGSKSVSKHYNVLAKIADGVNLTRDVVTEPGNVINPETLAKKCQELSKLGVNVKVLGEAQMKKLGFGALLGVGQGSRFESKLVIMEWKGAAKSQKPVAFVGKGVTFDTGGISIKPSGGMDEMKFDMGGSGTVIGLMKALAGRKAKVNAVGVVGLVENMPDGNAQRPGDVVTSYSGQTIEVLNTDAEGRLVLADALWYTQKHFKPKFIIDLATLTGAIIVALGSSRAGLFSNDDKLSEQLSKVGEKVDEPVWRLPLGDVYDKQINSQIADMQNIGTDREAGSITAAQFLQRFVNNTPWVHLDIAGTAWSKKDSALFAKGATGYGVRLLNQLVEDYYE
ncbi:MAG: leucyl aminopeptidase [Rickettsiales bacterium]